MRIQYTLLLFLLVSLFSCKKDTPMDNLSNVILKREGLLRVECNDCEVNYQVYTKEFNVGIDKGSNDISFFYAGDFDLKTEVLSKKQQKIRLVVIDSFGRIVSNELNDWNAGETRKRTFEISVK